MFVTEHFNFSFRYAENLFRVVNRLYSNGISEFEILHSEIADLEKKYMDSGYAKEPMFCRAVKYFRVFKGIDKILPMDEEKSGYIEWWNTKRHIYCKNNGSYYYNCIVSLLKSGISLEKILKEDERNTTDEYFKSICKKPTTYLINEYRTSIKLFRDYKGVVCNGI